MAAGRNHGSFIETASGAPLYYPNTSDADTGAMVTEGAAGTVSDITFANTILNSYTFTSNIVKISRELLTDEGFDVNSYLNEILARRLGRAMNDKLSTGTGSSQPKGIVTAATDSGVTIAADLPTLTEMQNLYHYVDVAYRNENSCWFMNDASWKQVKQMVVNSNLIADSQILSGVRPSFSEDGNTGVVFGRPVYINNDIPSTGSSGDKVMVFGDMSQFKIRLVGQPQLLRLDERYADSLSVGFILFHRMDSNIVTSATKALAYADRA